MDKFKYLVGYGLKKRIARKAFVVSNIIVLLLVVILINIPNFTGLFGSGDKESKYNIDFYNNTEQVSMQTDLSGLLNQGLEEELYVLTAKTGEFNEENFWEESEQDIAIIVNGTVAQPVIAIYTDDPMIYANISRTLEVLIISYQIEDYQVPQINLVLPPDYENPEESMMISSLMSFLALPMFLLVVMATQFVGVDIIEEKSTKAIETIISGVPANIHFYSKIVSSVVFVIIQGVLAIIYGAIGIGISKAFTTAAVSSGMMTGQEFDIIAFMIEIMPNWPVVLAMTLLFLIFGTLLYLVIAALFASMAVTQEDYQQFQTPLMLTLLMSFYAAMFAPMAGAETLIRVLNYIPIFSPMLTPVVYASGIISIGEALISLVLVIGTLVLFTYLFTPVYKVSILSYDQTKFFKRIKGYFKKGFQRNKKNNKK